MNVASMIQKHVCVVCAHARMYVRVIHFNLIKLFFLFIYVICFIEKQYFSKKYF